LPPTQHHNLFADDFSTNPWWWRDMPPAPTGLKDVPDQTDVVVIGGGYAGLSCALELAQAGGAVIVIDADDIGFGGSTRNAGFVSGRAGVGKQIDLRAAVGVERAGAMLDEAGDAFEFLQKRLIDENIDCDFRPCGRFAAAVTPGAYKKLEAKAAETNTGSADDFQLVSRSDQSTYINSDVYHGGTFIPEAGSIHPTKYHRGLLSLCVAAGVQFLSHCRVVGIHSTDTEKTVATIKGSIRAKNVALCTNGYTDHASPWHQRRIIPMSSTIIATEELGEDRVRSLLPHMCPIIDSRRVIRFSRPTPDGKRILFGGRAKFTPIDERESTALLHRQMTDVFPSLHDVKISNTWAGLMAFTFDFLPKTGIHDGVHYAIGCNGGAGIVMMSWLGRQTAQRILGTQNQRSAFEGLPFPTQPLYSGTPWFIPIIGNWYRFRDWVDLKLA
jgi:glycine/D-amino acid oxidase-like deaminating enzyme